MILFAAVAICAVSVPLLGGSLGRLLHIDFRYVWTLSAGLVLQVAVTMVGDSALTSNEAAVGHVLSYGLAAMFLWLNRGVPWLWLLGLGGFSNLTAIEANGGVMPASRSALIAAGRLPTSATHHFVNSRYQSGAHLSFLGDVFAIPKGWPLANAFSIGDVLIVGGAFLLLHSVGGSKLGQALSRLRGGVPGAPSAAPVAVATPTA